MSTDAKQQLREQFAADPQATFEALLQRDVGHGVRFDRTGAILEAEFDGLQRLAKLYSSSTVVPKEYQGNVANCFIGLQLAQRMGQNPFVVFQQTDIIHGKPGFKARYLTALLNTSGLIKGRIKYTKLGKEGTDSYGYQASAIDAASGEEVVGPPITWKLVKAEGWDKRPGSKWVTIPELMFHYRAAAWLVNTHYSEVSCGVLTVDELADTGDDEAPAKPKRTAADVLADIDRQPPHQREESPHVEQERGQLFATGESAQEAGL
jgi:hypothetical protein